MNSVLVFGQNGQVAAALRELQPQFIYISKEKCDFYKPQKIENILNLHRPKLIINTSAYTAVEGAEIDRELCQAINANAPGRIAQWCFQNNAILLHISTDFVFDGKMERPYVETDGCNPVNYYGQSKLEGELEIIKSKCLGYIFRTSWLFSGTKTNFVKAVLKTALEKTEMKMVTNQVGSPTYAKDLAASLISIALMLTKKRTEPSNRENLGIYHMANEGFVSRFEFAKEIIQLAKNLGYPIRLQKMEPIKSPQGSQVLQRPDNSQLNCKKLKDTFGIALPHWKSGLEEVLKDLYENSRI